MSSPCIRCSCYPCICLPASLQSFTTIPLTPNYLCITCWSTPCVCLDQRSTTDAAGPTIYCGICRMYPCVCPLNEHWFCSYCGNNFCTCRLPCGCSKGAGCCCSEDEQDDNWSHKGSNMVCGTCMWWVRKRETNLGRCRKKAPTLDGWPAVYETDWCGDHKIDETKTLCMVV